VDVEEYYRICYDSSEEHAFIMEKPDGSERRFVQAAAGLYYHDTAALTRNPDSGTALVNTVAANKSRYTERAYGQATLAHKLQQMIGYPSTQDFMKLVEGNMIPNCPISHADIITTEDIFGPSVDILKGKTVRQGEEHVQSDLSPVPRDILLLYQMVTLCVDIMYVNKLPFLVTISCHIKFAMIELLSNCQMGTVGKSITKVMHLYGSRGFLVTMVHADGEFEAVRGQLAACRRRN